ncbi:MAG: hypothetical protein PVI03_08130 [Candidatus Thorarchaeota archaeon]
MFIDIGQWKISVENSEEFRDLVLKFVNYQRDNRDEWPYKKAQFYMMLSDDESVEFWMYIDVFDSHEDFKKMDAVINKMLETDPDMKATFDRMFALQVPDSWKTTQWSEVGKLHIE